MQNIALAEYKVGDSDERQWGRYVVTAVGINAQGEEFCEKDITVKPQQALSLQSHAMRREHWTVLEGTLTVILDDKILTLYKGEDVRIPVGGIHCMANLAFSDNCVVREMQEGICREEDIVRYADAYGRATVAPTDERTKKSLQLYAQTLSLIQK